MGNIVVTNNQINQTIKSVDCFNDGQEDKVDRIGKNTLQNCNWGKTARRPHSFSIEGKLTPQDLQVSKQMNPAYALFNCPVTSFKTAVYLERGFIPPLSLSNSSRPRPMNVEGLMKADWTADFFTNLDPKRGYFYVRSCCKTMLDYVMQRLGKGTHAILAANRVGLPFGHMWNYVYNDKIKESSNFVLLDSYSKSYHNNALKKPDVFINEYNTNDLEAIIFYDKTPENLDLISRVT